MDGGRDSGGSGDTTNYTEPQIESVLAAIGIEVQGETANDFICYCPIHGNRNSPSFSVSRVNGKFICFNPSCREHGSLIELVREVTKAGEFQARRLIILNKNADVTTIEQRVKKALAPVAPFEEFGQDKIDEMAEAFWKNDEAISYMVKERGFTEETLRHFKIGYSNSMRMLAVPMHDIKGMPIGVIGRPVGRDNKAFKNSRRLPTSKTLWNIHRAKRTGDKVIIVESSFDAMRVHQAGYPNVVASLGGNFSQYHAEQLQRIFTTIINMTDFDKRSEHIYPGCRKCFRNGSNLCAGHNPGRDLGSRIKEMVPHARILWASYEDKMAYPHRAKDAGDMSDDEIRQCLRNAVPDYIYQRWGLY